ncbi:MAG TPA: oligoendopeptidase F [Bacillota bacterium]|nr:oligoendopeptidase F [Bacillota bacterium]
MTEEVKQAPEREEIQADYKWRLEDLFGSIGEWEEKAGELFELLPELSAFAGRLGEGAEVLFQCVELMERIQLLAERLYVYALMKSDEDTRSGEGQALKSRAISLYSQTKAAMAFFEPEVLSLGEEQLNNYLLSEPSLKLYQHFFDQILRLAPHTLSREQEEILALSSELAAVPANVHSSLSNADLKFGIIQDEAGRKVELTSGNYIQFMRSPKRQVRKAAFQALYSAYIDHKYTFAALLESSLRKDLFYAKLRKYKSTLESSLFADNIPEAVYHNLLAAVHEGLPVMHKYQELRGEFLELDEIRAYDLYAPLFSAQPAVTYSKAQEILLEALAPLGEEYLKILGEAFSAGWIDVYENRGKRSGAYAWGAYGTHPYVLLNYTDNLEGLYTLAHELGHAVHSYLSNRAQPYVYADYTIFLAEVASTVNEVLLTRHLLRTWEGEERLAVLNYYLEQFRTTVFRQTKFAEFELKAHELVASGKPCTLESLNELYLDLNRTYYGPAVVLDQELAYEWARIPHFYTPFYVYKYATGFSSAVALAEQIEEKGSEKYLEFLSSGSSDYSLAILKRAGVDLRTAEPFRKALGDFAQSVQKLADLKAGR